MTQSFELDPKTEIGTALRRAALEQFEMACRELKSQPDDIDRAVHEARKSIKHLRALLRLVRPELKSAYKRENRVLRDSARNLSKYRDARASIAAFDDLAAWCGDADLAEKFAAIRAALVKRHEKLFQDGELAAELGQVLDHLNESARRSDVLMHVRNAKTLQKGLEKTYARARRSFSTARESHRGEDLHEWRKRVKYHRYHLQLLRPAWRKVIKARWKEVKRLSSLLGDEHDLQTLQHRVLAIGALEIDEAMRADFVAQVGRRRVALQHEAIALGELVFLEKPRAVSRRLRGYWLVAVDSTPLKATERRAP